MLRLTAGWPKAAGLRSRTWMPEKARAWRRRAVGIVVVALAATPSLALLPAQPASADAVRETQTWVLNMLHVQGAWQHTEGQGVVVAVIDSGVNGNVSDLVGSVEDDDDQPNDSGVYTSPGNPNWGVHGTWMASLIAGHGSPGSPDAIGPNGIVGTAPGATILSIRVITDPTDPNYAKYQHETASKGQRELARAIIYAVKHGAGVISMSLGYSQQSLVVRQALQDAYNHNVVVVASAGNSGNAAGADGKGHAAYSFPANYPGVLAVGAVNSSGQLASFSSENLSVQVAAPGYRVPAQGRDGQYWYVSGTSPACALTAGVVALIKSEYRGLTDSQVISAITSTTTLKPPHGYDQQIGFGVVDAAAALAAAGKLAAAGRPPSILSAGSHFGGGVQAIPGPPVAPRGPLDLVLYCLLGAACLALVALATSRLLALRDAAVDRSAGPWPPGQPTRGGVPASGVPASGVQASGVPASSVPARGLTSSAPRAEDPDATLPVPVWRPDASASPPPQGQAAEQPLPGARHAAPRDGQHNWPEQA